MRASLVALAATACTWVPALADSTPAQAVALIEKRCGQCHGDQTAAGGLRLVGRDQLLKGGKRALP